MRYLFSTTLCILILSALACAALLTDPALEIRIPVPTDWAVYGDSGTYPVEIVHGSGNAELSIFRSDLRQDQLIAGPDDLKQSVQKVIDSVVMTLPGAKMLTNTGINEISRMGFALEFVSTDPAAGSVLHHRLFAWLYRHTDGHQILFTLWGKSRFQTYAEHAIDIKGMQEDFAYTGPKSDSAVKADTNPFLIPAMLVVFLAVALLYYRSAKMRARRQVPFGHQSWWNCSCGQRNPDAAPVCRQCGKPKLAETVR